MMRRPIRFLKPNPFDRFPKWVNINGHKYAIRFVEGFSDKGKRKDNQCGAVDYNNQQILIAKDLPYSRACETLLHESLHAIQGEYQYPELKKLKERCVEQLACCFYALLANNRWLSFPDTENKKASSLTWPDMMLVKRLIDKGASAAFPIQLPLVRNK